MYNSKASVLALYRLHHTLLNPYLALSVYTYMTLSRNGTQLTQGLHLKTLISHRTNAHVWLAVSPKVDSSITLSHGFVTT